MAPRKPDGGGQGRGLRRILSIVLLALAVAFAGVSVYLAQSSLRLHLTGVETTATVRALQALRAHRRHASPSYLLTYRFEVDGTPFDGQRFVSRETFDTLKRGDRTFTLRYLPSDPLTNDMDPLNALLGIFISAILAVTLAACGLLMLRGLPTAPTGAMAGPKQPT